MAQEGFPAGASVLRLVASALGRNVMPTLKIAPRGSQGQQSPCDITTNTDTRRDPCGSGLRSLGHDEPKVLAELEAGHKSFPVADRRLVDCTGASATSIVWPRSVLVAYGLSYRSPVFLRSLQGVPCLMRSQYVGRRKLDNVRSLREYGPRQK